MRKKLFIPLLLAAGVLSIGSISALSTYERVGADPEPETAIEMNSSFFTNWTDDAGVFDGAGATFWDAYHFFNSLGSFYRGESKGDWKGTLTSRTWKQTTQYVYFTWSAANNTDDCTLTFRYGGLSSVMKNDTFVENPMMLRYFKIPDADYETLIAANPEGFDMSVDLYDNLLSGGYGFHNFGYLHVNQTEEQVSDAMRYYLNSLDHDGGEWQVNKRKEIFNHYTVGNAGLKEVFYRTVSNGDEDFDNNSDFLKHWYFDYNYFNGSNWAIHFDRAIGTDSYRPDAATNMPFNKTGSGYFRGWFENDELGGFVSGDGSIYRFVSRPFVLSGTGVISIKMAGTASLHVIDPATRQDLAWADCQTFKTDGNQADLMDGSFNTCTMVRHVINLEAYLGKKIQLAIADVSDGGWGAAYFDELDTTHAAYPAFQVDAFVQSNNSGDHNIYKADKYINSTMKDGSNANGLIYVDSADMNRANDNAILSHVDNSAANAAYNFLNYYYSNRANEGVRINLLNSYLALNATAKTIVDSSSNVLGASDTPATVGDAISALLGGYTQCTISFDANGGEGSMSSLTLVNGSTYTLPSCPFTAPEGKRFLKWNTEDDDSGTSKNPDDPYDVSENVTFYAIWEVIPAREQIEALETKTVLGYDYTGDSDENFAFSNLKIRFRGALDCSLWAELNSEETIQGYGVMVSLGTSTEGYLGDRHFETEYATKLEAASGNVDAAISALCDGTKIKNFYNDNSVESPFSNGVKCSWSLAQEVKYSVPENKVHVLTRQYVAVAYIRTNSGLVFFDETRVSVKDIALQMIASDQYDDSSMGGSLHHLAHLGE